MGTKKKILILAAAVHSSRWNCVRVVFWDQGSTQ